MTICLTLSSLIQSLHPLLPLTIDNSSKFLVLCKYIHSVIPPFCRRPWNIFNVGKKGGHVLFEFLGGGVSKKRGVVFSGGPEDFLKVIFNCWSNITDEKCRLRGADPVFVIRGGPNSEHFLSNLRKLLKRGKFFLTTQSLIVKRNWVYINQFIKTCFL